MSITNIEVDAFLFNQMGIGQSELPLKKPLRMRSLGSTVVLAGPNGAGKTRLLRLLGKLLTKKLSVDSLQQLKRNEDQDLRAIDEWDRRIAELRSSQQPPINIESEILALESNRTQAEHRIADYDLTRLFSDCVTLDTNDAPRIVQFVPKTPRLGDPSELPERTVGERADSLKNSPENAEDNAPAYARRVLRRAEEAGYKRLKTDEASGAKSQKSPEEVSAQQLQAILESLIGLPSPIDLQDSRLTIASFLNYSDTLSPGQQILFQFGCMLHSQRAELANCIVLMDEPENHLHPAVLAQVVERLRQLLDGSQLWIATHSVPLIAQMLATDADSLWFVKDGHVSRSGRSPEKVLESLMGEGDGAANLHDLTLLPAQYAAVRFLGECLDAPGVVGANIHDPQTKQISAILHALESDRAAAGKPLRVLDCGAGKGRLLATLREGERDVRDWLDYIAYDIDQKSRSDCEREIRASYGAESVKRWFDDLSDVRTHTRSRPIDVIVMCNVFHEITPRDWLPDLGQNGRLTKLLADSGALLIVEDYGIKIGERAHEYGFLLFDDHELRELFDISDQDLSAKRFVRQISGDSNYGSRLTAHLIGKECMERMSTQTQMKAIRTLYDRMTHKVRRFLEDPVAKLGEEGRDYARCAQLMANTAIWLGDHGQSVTAATAPKSIS